jgi:hypothetical protein
MKKWNIFFTCLLCLSLVANVHYCKETNKPAEVRVETRTEYVEIKDMVPMMVESRTTGETVTLKAKVNPVGKTTGVVKAHRHATNHEPDRMALELEPDTTTTVCIMGDSAVVTLPVEQRVYKDSLYTAYVSGYRPRLDSITLRLPHTYTTVTQTIRKPSRQWAVGPAIGVGYGIMGKQLDVYVGMGVTLNILP